MQEIVEDPGRDNDDGKEDDLFVYETGRSMRAIKRERENLPKRRKVKNMTINLGVKLIFTPFGAWGVYCCCCRFRCRCRC